MKSVPFVSLVCLVLLAACGAPLEPTQSVDREAPDDTDTPDDGEEPDDIDPTEDVNDIDEPPAPADDEQAAPSSGCGVAPPDEERWTVVHDGRDRKAFVVLPPDYDPSRPTPVVINFHGRNSNATQQRYLTGMDDDAGARGAIVVYPEGIGGTWNAGVCCGEAQERDIDDVGFTGALLDALEEQLCVDDARVFVTGLSNGGFMSHHLGCRLADRISGLAAVAGPNGTSGCEPARPIPVLHIHGNADDVVSYAGYAGFVSAQGSMEAWAARNGCGDDVNTSFDDGNTTCVSWTACTSAVELCTIEGGGHQWPGGMTIPFMGDNSSPLDANAHMLDFFGL